jgi:hypothetical protein
LIYLKHNREYVQFFQNVLEIERDLLLPFYFVLV